jgi:hypothetical protein
MDVVLICIHILAALLFSALLSVSLGWLLLRRVFGRFLVVRTRRAPRQTATAKDSSLAARIRRQTHAKTA